MAKDANDLESLLDELEQAPHGAEVSLGDMLEATGRRSFGPALLVPGLILVTPLGGVPGMASAMGIVALLVAGQLVMARRHFWLPQWLLRRKVDASTFRKALKLLRRPARGVDRLLRPRLELVLQRPLIALIALACVIVGFVMPFLELVPFADTAPGVAMLAFGLALISHDGLLALVAAAFCALSLGLVALAFL